MIAPVHESPQYLLLDNVSWKTYEGLLRDLERQHRRITSTLEVIGHFTSSVG